MMKQGTLVGTDQFGNKYYENLSYQAGAAWAAATVLSGRSVSAPVV